jgi:hypothetical protein
VIAAVLARATVDDARLVEMDVCLDQTAAAEAAAGVICGRVADKFWLDRRDTAVLKTDVGRGVETPGDARIADHVIDHLRTLMP